jgi:hypothetical protein
MSDNYKLEAEINELDKSFIKYSKSKEIEEESSNNKSLISEEAITGSNYLINKSVDSDVSSICNLISINTAKIDEDSYPTSNELNIYDSFESKYKPKQYYFRCVTKTSSEIPAEDSRRLVDNILMYYRGNSLGLQEDLLNNDW